MAETNETKDTIDVDALAKVLADSMRRLHVSVPALKSVSLAELCNLYMEDYAKLFKVEDSWKGDAGRIRNHLPDSLKARSILDIRRKELDSLHKEIGRNTGRYAANRTLELLTSMYRQAQVWELYPEDRLIPTYKIRMFKEPAREIFVAREDMPALAKSIAKCKSRRVQVAIWLYLFTALRRDELRKAKWADLDTLNWELKIPVTKNGKAHVVHLGAEAMALLATLPRSGDYILQGDAPGKPISKTSLWRAWDRIRSRVNLQHVRIHDLRRTVASWMAQSGDPLPLISKVLNHSSLRATEIYARFQQKDVRQVMLTHSDTVAKHVDSPRKAG